MKKLHESDCSPYMVRLHIDNRDVICSINRQTPSCSPCI
jgi:hypothetical protein